MYFHSMKDVFEQVVFSLVQKEGVIEGKMMSSPALKYKGKVFCFYHKERMCFKLGQPSSLLDRGLPVELLSPFKTKPPLKGWFWIDGSASDQWPYFSELALDEISG